jgi:hypothetical protein
MAAGSCQGIMKSIATTGIWPSCQPAAVVIGGKNGAEALLMRIRPNSCWADVMTLLSIH